MGLKEKLTGKVDEFKAKRQTEHEIRELENRRYEEHYARSAQVEAIHSAEARAEQQAYARAHKPALKDRLLNAGKKFEGTGENLMTRMANTQRQPAPRRAPRVPRSKYRGRPVKYIQVPRAAQSQPQRRFVEVGDTQHNSALSSHIEDAFSFKPVSSGKNPILGGGINEAFSFNSKKKRR